VCDGYILYHTHPGTIPIPTLTGHPETMSEDTPKLVILKRYLMDSPKASHPETIPIYLGIGVQDLRDNPVFSDIGEQINMINSA